MHPYPVAPTMTMVDSMVFEDPVCENRKRGDPWSGGMQHCKRRRLDPSEFLVNNTELDGSYSKDGCYRGMNNKSTNSKDLVPSKRRCVHEPFQHWSPKNFSWMLGNLPKQQVSTQALSTSRAMVVWKPPCSSTPASIGRLPSTVSSDDDSEDDDTILLVKGAESTDTIEDDDMMDISNDVA